MVVCSVFNCKSNNDKRLKRNQNNSVELQPIKFFKYPRNEHFVKIWIQKTGRKDKFNVKTSYICSKHFEKHHYVRNLQHELLNYSPKNSKKLKEDAIPTENLPLSLTTNKLAESERLKRYVKKQSKETVVNILKEIGNENNLLTEPEIIIPQAVADLEQPNCFSQATCVDDLSKELINKSTTSRSSPTKIELIKKNKALMKKVYVLEQENNCYKKLFTEGQRKKMQKKGKRVKWEVEDITQAISIYSSGPKAYRLLLKRDYPLPAVSTLRRRVAKAK